MCHRMKRRVMIISALVGFGTLVCAGKGFAATPDAPLRPQVAAAAKHDLSPPLRSMKVIPPSPAAPMRVIPLRPLPKREGIAAPFGKVQALDLVIQNWSGALTMPSPIRSFEGISNVDAVLPPDTNGDVGLNHYVQWVNLSFAIYNKSGTLLFGPAAGNTLWTDFGGPCQTTNDGDPIVLYDHLADRWLMSQFANADTGPPFFQCIAISQTGDPTGAWFRYAFVYSTTKFNDYPKFGVWPDGYYMTANQFIGNTSSGAGVVAFERQKMLDGLPAQMVYFDLFSVNPNFGGMLPAHLNGPPPPDGTPNFVVEVDDTIFGFPTDSLRIWAFHVDWTTTADSTFGVSGNPNTILDTAPFDANLCNFSANCIPQHGTTRRLDALSDRLMYRLQYRHFGDHDSLVVNHTVDVDGTDHAGIRWYEIRDPGGTPVIYQQGTYAPDSAHRWMGSVAMDKNGNMALGYSVSDGDLFPSIRYVGRLTDDPLGTLPQGEMELIAGTGSQTSGFSRWGDYSSMSVDPVDDCTFWYTQEYYASTSSSGWRTRIGAFRFPSCGLPPGTDLSIVKTDLPDPIPLGGTLTYTLSVINNGPDAATGVVVTDTLPAGATFLSATSPCTETSGTVTCSLGSLTSGSQVTLNIYVVPTGAGTISNSASVTGNEPDPDLANNAATTETLVTAGGAACVGTGSLAIQGTVNTLNGARIAGGLMTLTGSGGCSSSVLTDAKGKYRFNRLAAGTYIVTPSKAGCSFTPPGQSVTISKKKPTVGFTAACQ